MIPCTSSGSSCSVSAVKLAMSANSTVTRRRSPSSAARADRPRVARRRCRQAGWRHVGRQVEPAAHSRPRRGAALAAKARPGPARARRMARSATPAPHRTLSQKRCSAGILGRAGGALHARVLARARVARVRSRCRARSRAERLDPRTVDPCDRSNAFRLQFSPYSAAQLPPAISARSPSGTSLKCSASASRDFGQVLSECG